MRGPKEPPSEIPPMTDWGLSKQAVDSHVNAVLRDCRIAKRLVAAMAEVGHRECLYQMPMILITVEYIQAMGDWYLKT